MLAGAEAAPAEDGLTLEELVAKARQLVEGGMGVSAAAKAAAQGSAYGKRDIYRELMKTED